MSSPPRKRAGVTKPCVISENPPEGCQPIYVRDLRGTSPGKRRPLFSAQHDNPEGESAGWEMKKGGYHQRTDMNGSSNVPPARRAIFRSILDPAKEREQREGKTEGGRLRELGWADAKRGAQEQAEPKHKIQYRGKRYGLYPSKESVIGMATPKKMCRPEKIPRDEEQRIEKRQVGNDVTEAQRNEECLRSLSSPLKPRRRLQGLNKEQGHSFTEKDKENKEGNKKGAYPKKQDAEGQEKENEGKKRNKNKKKKKKNKKNKKNGKVEEEESTAAR